jgi:hypothetical protein
VPIRLNVDGWGVGHNVLDEYNDLDTDWDIENLAMTYVPGLAEIVGSDPSSGTYRYYSEDDEEMVRLLRIRTQTGRPLASNRFMSEVEAFLRRRVRPLPVGRQHGWRKDKTRGKDK